MMTIEASTSMEDYDVDINSCNMLIGGKNFSIIEDKEISTLGSSLRFSNFILSKKNNKIQSQKDL